MPLRSTDSLCLDVSVQTHLKSLGSDPQTDNHLWIPINQTKELVTACKSSKSEHSEIERTQISNRRSVQSAQVR